LGESTGFVGADARGGTKGLDGLKVLNEHELLSHSCGGEGQRKGDSSEESLGHIGDDDTNHENDGLDNFVTDGNGEDQEGDTEEDSDSRDDEDEPVDLDGKRGLLGFSLRGKVGNLTNEGSVTSPDANTESGSLSALGTEEACVLGLEDGVRRLLLGGHEDFNGLTSEGSVVDLHLVGLEDDKIGRDVLTTLNLDDISRDHFFGGAFSHLAFSDDVTLGRDEVLELGHHFGGFGGLLVRENGGDEHDSSEYNTKVQIGSVSFIRLDNVSNDTENCTELE
jgi:hypothetical protein